MLESLRRTVALGATAQAAILLAVGIYALVEGIIEVLPTGLLIFGAIGLVGARPAAHD